MEFARDGGSIPDSLPFLLSFHGLVSQQAVQPLVLHQARIHICGAGRRDVLFRHLAASEDQCYLPISCQHDEETGANIAKDFFSISARSFVMMAHVLPPPELASKASMLCMQMHLQRPHRLQGHARISKSPGLQLLPFRSLR